MLQRKAMRPRIRKQDRLFWVALSRIWPGWKGACQIVRPATVVAWHRAGFRVFWSWKSRHASHHQGRIAVGQEVRSLIRRMAQDNSSWGAPRIQGELAKLGFRVSERSVQRWLPRRPRDPKRTQAWRALLDNHREVIAAMVFCVKPTASFNHPMQRVEWSELAFPELLAEVLEKKAIPSFMLVQKEKGYSMPISSKNSGSMHFLEKTGSNPVLAKDR